MEICTKINVDMYRSTMIPVNIIDFQIVVYHMVFRATKTRLHLNISKVGGGIELPQHMGFAII